MRPIPTKLRTELSNDSYYKTCARLGDGECGGRITWEHVIIYASKQLNERWAIIPLCERHHDVGVYQDTGDLQKEVNVWIALNRATETELRLVSKAINYLQVRERLNKIYGIYRESINGWKGWARLRERIQQSEIQTVAQGQSGQTIQGRHKPKSVKGSERLLLQRSDPRNTEYL